MFKLGETIVWQTKWGSLFLGKVDALFTDKRGVKCLHANCVDDVYGPRGFHFIADIDSCKIFLGTSIKTIEHKNTIDLQSSRS
jgi:hypothetical protein